MTTKARITKLETVWHRRPAACWSAGSACTKHELVGDGSDDPPMPDLPATCADCGRAILWRVIVLPGVDASRI